MQRVWLTATYHFPATYSCRIPMSSANSAPVLPTPGPATVRLALIRTGIEVLGFKATQETLFPSLRAATLRICPPERVALSWHRERAYKYSESKEKTPHTSREGVWQETISVREQAHAFGVMTLSIEVPLMLESVYRSVLCAVGYWGRTDSLTTCLDITNDDPVPDLYVAPLRAVKQPYRLQPYFSAIAAEFRDPQVTWEEVIGMAPDGKNSPFRLDIYLWPLVVTRHTKAGKVLLRQPCLL